MHIVFVSHTAISMWGNGREKLVDWTKSTNKIRELPNNDRLGNLIESIMTLSVLYFPKSYLMLALLRRMPR
jgi:hypothetical protein